MTALTLELLGLYRIRASGGAELRIASRKARALLAYLSLRPGEAHSRERLARLLWEDAEEELARSSLRQVLAALRKTLPEYARGALISTVDSVRLDGALVATDVGAFRRALLESPSICGLKEAVAHYRGDLLEGFDARSASFDEWLSAERLALRKQATEALHTLAHLCAVNSDAQSALAACTRLVSLDPLNESAHRMIMQLHAMRQCYTEALRQYRLCRNALRRELDVSPEPATEQLYRDLMRRRRSAAPSAATEELPDAPADAAHLDRGMRLAPGVPLDADAQSSSRTQIAPQLREAVILVARLEGLLEAEEQLDPEEALRLASDFEACVRTATKEYAGAADRRIGSDVLAVFGARTSRGNEPERAVRAALMLREAVRRRSWPEGDSPSLALRIGLAQGQVLCGAELFPVTGKSTHRAHQLAARAADHEILISDELRRSLGEAVHAELATAGAWSLKSMRIAHEAPQPFVGRRPELALLLAAVEQCRATRRGRAILVRGEAGMGKTRLIAAVRCAAAQHGVRVHCVQACDFGQSPGRRPITALALSLLGVDPGAPAPERAAAVRNAARGLDQIAGLSDLVDAPLDAELAAFANAMEPGARQRGRALALAGLIENAAHRSTLLIIVEDVHWAEEDELKRLAEIGAVVANCSAALIMTTRAEDDPIDAGWRARARGCPLSSLDLACLADDEARELAKHYSDLTTAAIEECVRRAEGHPLFLDQLLRAARAGRDALPGSVRSLVLARADRLSTRDHSALQAAAVLGQRASLAALRHILDDADYEPAGLIQAALARTDGPDLEFCHALFREAIYESALRSRRRELHRAAAQWFAPVDAVLHADHLAAADDENAAAAYVRAALDDMSALRLERALALASRAASLARDPATQSQTRTLRGELLLQLGRTHDALAAYREALELAADRREQGPAWLGIASSLRIMDRLDEALDALDRAEAALRDDLDSAARARLLTLRGNLCFPLGKTDECLRAHAQAHRYAVQAGAHSEIARALGGLGDACYQRGRMLTARGYFEQCIQEARSNGLLDALLAYLPMLGVTQIYTGAPAAGCDSCAEALELARRIGGVRGEMLAHLVMGTGLQVQRRTLECRQSAGEALKLARKIGARRFEAESLCMIAVSIAAEDRGRALQLAEEALQTGREAGASYCGPVLLGAVARISPQADRRRTALREGEKLLAQGCVSHCYLEFYQYAIDVSLGENAWAQARRYADALERYTAEEPLPLTELLIARGRLLADVGEGLAVAGGAIADTRAQLEALRANLAAMNAYAALEAVAETLVTLRAAQTSQRPAPVSAR